MQALVTEPAVPHSTRVADIPEPTGDGLLLRVLEVGVCGTDREISEGQFGEPAEGTSLEATEKLRRTLPIHGIMRKKRSTPGLAVPASRNRA